MQRNIETLSKKELRKYAKEIGINDDDYENLKDFRKLISSLSSSHAPISFLHEAPLTACESHWHRLDKISQEMLNTLEECEKFGSDYSQLKTKINRIKENIPKFRKQFRIVVLGEKKAGKSSVINLLLGEKLLPVDDSACTATICELHFSENKGLVLYPLDDGSPVWADLSSNAPDILKQHLSFGDATDRVAKYSKAIIKWPAQCLKSGMVIVDTPGLNDLEELSKLTKSETIVSPIFLFVLSCKNGLTETLRVLISNINDEPAFFLSTHLDCVQDKENVIKKLKIDIQKQLKKELEQDQFCAIDTKASLNRILNNIRATDSLIEFQRSIAQFFSTSLLKLSKNIIEFFQQDILRMIKSKAERFLEQTSSEKIEIDQKIIKLRHIFKRSSLQYQTIQNSTKKGIELVLATVSEEMKQLLQANRSLLLTDAKMSKLDVSALHRSIHKLVCPVHPFSRTKWNKCDSFTDAKIMLQCCSKMIKKQAETRLKEEIATLFKNQLADLIEFSDDFVCDLGENEIIRNPFLFPALILSFLLSPITIPIQMIADELVTDWNYTLNEILKKFSVEHCRLIIPEEVVKQIIGAFNNSRIEVAHLLESLEGIPEDLEKKIILYEKQLQLLGKREKKIELFKLLYHTKEYPTLKIWKEKSNSRKLAKAFELVTSLDKSHNLYIPEDVLNRDDVLFNGSYAIIPLVDESPWSKHIWASIKFNFWEYVTKMDSSSSVMLEISNLKMYFNPKLICAIVSELDHQQTTNMTLGWHGTKDDNHNSILTFGFVEQQEQKLDSGYYGAGFYFSHYPHYSLHYIKYRPPNSTLGFNLNRIGSTMNVLLSWLALGKRFVVKDLSYKGKSCKYGYHSHYVEVTLKPGNYSPLNFYPALEGEPVMADEIVVFNSSQALPMFEVFVTRIK